MNLPDFSPGPVAVAEVPVARRPPPALHHYIIPHHTTPSPSPFKLTNAAPTPRKTPPMTSPGTTAMAAPSSLRGAHSSNSIGSRRGARKWDESVPPVLRPLIRAYILGYASSVGPRIVTLVLQFISARRQQRRRQRRGDPASDPDAPQLLSDSPPPQESFASSLRRILVSGFDPRRFPAFCAALIGGATMLEVRTTCPFPPPPPPVAFGIFFFLFQWLRLSRRPSRTTPRIPHHTGTQPS